MIIRSRAIVALVACALASSSLPSQVVSSPSPFASISGTAVDSIRGGYLTGAVVRVNGTSRAATTDSLGRFRIDSVTAGLHQLELIHPLLDTLGMVLKTPPMSFRAGENGWIRLSVPSDATVIAAKCAVADRARGPAAIVGMVLEAETDAPAIGASVSLEWIDLEPIGRSFRRVVRKRTGAVQGDGSFRICGLPADFSANAVATRGSDSTSVVGVRVVPLLAVVSLFLPDRTDRPSERRGRGVLAGQIVGADGAPIARARVAVDGEEAAALSGDDGRFAVSGLRSGTRTVSVRALGYQPVERVVAISSLEPRNLNVTLDKFVPVLKAVRITAVRDVALERVGFTERQRDQPTGRFLTPDYIERRNPQKLAHLLETFPELRRGCVRYFIDGARLLSASKDDVPYIAPSSPISRDDSTPDSFLNAGELGAVEIYDRTNAPGEFLSTARNGATCAIVVIWTKFKLGF